MNYYGNNNPRNSQRKNMKSFTRSDKFGLFDNQTLLKEKKILSNDIMRVKKTNNDLQKDVNIAQKEYDQNQLVEIDYLYKSNTNPIYAESKYKTMAYSKQINHLENELTKLNNYNNNLIKYFSEEALSDIKTEVCFEKHIIAQQKEELKMLQEIYSKNKNLFNSKKYIATVNKYNEQKKELNERKNELKTIVNEEQNLNNILDSYQVLPKTIEKEENEIQKLRTRLDNLIHQKNSKTRDLNDLKKRIETENNDMEKKKKEAKKAPLKTKRRTNYVNPKLIARRIIVSQPSSGRCLSNTNNQSPKTQRIQNEAVAKSNSTENDSSDKESSDGSSSDYEKEINSDSYKNKPEKTEKALSTNLSRSSSSAAQNSDSDSDRSSEAENLTEPHSGKHTSSEDEESNSDSSENEESKKDDNMKNDHSSSDGKSENEDEKDSENDSEENDSSKNESSDEHKDDNSSNDDKKDDKKPFNNVISDADHSHGDYSDASLDNQNENKAESETKDGDSSGSFKD